MRRRIDQLSPEARDLLTFAAVAGQRFDFALLERLTGRGERELLRQIKELMAAQLVVEQSEERFAFRHALTRQSVYKGLLARERRTLHRQVAEALEALYADALDAHLADLAYHYSEGGVWEKALEYARLVGERAQALNAPHAAVEQFTRALDAAGHLGVSAPADIYQARGHAYETLGDFEYALADYEAALARAEATEDRQAEWSTLVALGQLWAGRDYGRTGEYARRAYERAQAMGQPSLVARSLNRFANWHLNVDQPAEARRYHREALASFEAQGDLQGVADTLDLLGMASVLSGDMVRATENYQRAVELYRSLGDRRGLSSSLAGITIRAATYQSEVMVLPDTTLADAIRDGEEAVKLAHEIDWRSGELFPLWLLGLAYGARGDFTRAFECAEAGLRGAEDIGHQQWATGSRYALAALYLCIHAYPRAQELMEIALPQANSTGSWHWIRFCAGTLACALVGQGRLDEAEAVLDEYLPPSTPYETLGQRVAWCARIELALARHDPALALRLTEEQIAASPHATREKPPLRLALFQGQALLALHRAEEAETLLLSAKTIAESHGARYTQWRIWDTLGHLYAAEGRTEDAAHAFTAARIWPSRLARQCPTLPCVMPSYIRRR